MGDRGESEREMMQQSITFSVDVEPVSQGSMNYGAHGRMYHSNSRLPGYRSIVGLKARQAAREAGWKLPVDHAVKTDELYVLPKPKTTRFRLFPAGKPDLDKLERAVGDALSPKQKHLRVLADDSRICERRSRKVYPEREDEGPEVIVTITLLEGADK